MRDLNLNPYNVLFLCTGNSARSILAEAILDREGGGHFRAFSAGSDPKGRVHPGALELLSSLDYPVHFLRSKGWEEFAGPGTPQLDFIFTVCDNAAGEVCPIWPGHPMTVHWGIEDPAAATPDAQPEAFRRAYMLLRSRIAAFLALPLETIDGAALKAALRAIGRAEGATPRRPGPGIATDVIIYHNPECGTSRNTLAMIRNAGIEPHVVEYLKSPPTRAMLIQLIDRAGMTPRDLLQEKGTPFAELGLENESLSDDALVDAMMAHPILINRPLVVSPIGVKLCRPSEEVLDLLPAPQLAAFAKEGGELVIDAHGQRVS